MQELLSFYLEKKSTLFLMPTPLWDQLLWDDFQVQFIEKMLPFEPLILVESSKVLRKKWIGSGLPRDWINQFVEYSEHNMEEFAREVAKKIRAGKNALLFSDGGLPVFCDPGVHLVREIRLQGQKGSVHCLPFSNSAIQALILSGFSQNEFYFAGFLPQKKELRENKWREILLSNKTTILMETPYRLSKTYNDLKRQQVLLNKKKLFWAFDLNSPREEHLWGDISSFSEERFQEKREFVLVIEGKI